MPEPLVVLTRETEENATLAAALAARRLEVLEIPCLRTEPLADDSALARTLRTLGPDDVLVVTSPTGAEAILAAVRPDELRAPLYAIGEVTARPLRAVGLTVETPAVADGASLARDLSLPRGRVVLARSDRALPAPVEVLRSRGALVEDVIAYRTVPGASGDVPVLRERLGSGPVVVVFASPSAVDGMLTAVRAEELAGARLVAIGPATAARIRERVGTAPLVAERPSNDALLAVIEQCLEEIRDVARA